MCGGVPTGEWSRGGLRESECKASDKCIPQDRNTFGFILHTVAIYCANMQFLGTRSLLTYKPVYLSHVVVHSPGVCRPSCLYWLGAMLGGIGAAYNTESNASTTGNMNKYTIYSQASKQHLYYSTWTVADTHMYRRFTY